MEIFTTLNAEKAREKELALEERKVGVAEENARTGRRKVELSGALEAAKLLMKVWGILQDGQMEPKEKLALATECIAKGSPQLVADAPREPVIINRPVERQPVARQGDREATAA